MDSREDLERASAGSLRVHLHDRLDRIEVGPFAGYLPSPRLKPHPGVSLPRAAIKAAVLVVAIMGGLVAAVELTPPDMENGAASLIVATDFDALARMSDVIVVGTVTAKGGTRELARDPKDPTRPDPNRTVESQDYGFSVEEVLKGEAVGTITVTSARSGTVTKGWRTANFSYANFVPLTVGKRYVLLLRLLRYDPGTYVLGFEPSRFEIGGDAVARSNWEQVNVYFPNRPAGEFVDDLRAAIARTNSPSPAR
jgi:hypothetical protein